jgi:hypothetical protein
MVTAELGPHRVVSEYYVSFREAIAPDVALLRGVEGHRAITEFDRPICLLRTAKQHEDNIEAREFFGDWIAKHPTWPETADALAGLLKLALRNSPASADECAATERWLNRGASDQQRSQAVSSSPSVRTWLSASTRESQGF